MFSFLKSPIDEAYARFAAQKDITTYELALILELNQSYITKDQYEIFQRVGTGLERHFHILEKFRNKS